jgi:sporulation protein YlmC with PRC-barrel domain
MSVIKALSNRTVAAAMLAVAAVACGGAAHAQSPARDRNGIGSSESYEEYLKGGDVRVSELVGKRVHGSGGDDIGEIEEVLMRKSRVGDLALIVSVGGLLDIGDKLIARPLEDFRISADGHELYLDVTEQQLSAEPSYSYKNEADEQTPSAAAPSARAGAMGERVAGLIGASVVDESGEEIGEVDDVLIAGDGDGESRAVLSVGGFLGVGNKLVAVPFADVEITQSVEDAEGSFAEPQVRVNLQADAVERLPEFEYAERGQRTAAL